jgi:hypothetical protein
MVYFGSPHFKSIIEDGIVFVISKAITVGWYITTKLNPQRGFPGIEVGDLISIGREKTYMNSLFWIEETEMFSHKHKSFIKLNPGEDITGIVVIKRDKEGEKDSQDVWEDKNYTEIVIAYKSSLCTVRDTQWFSGLVIKKY